MQEWMPGGWRKTVDGAEKRRQFRVIENIWGKITIPADKPLGKDIGGNTHSIQI